MTKEELKELSMLIQKFYEEEMCKGGEPILFPKSIDVIETRNKESILLARYIVASVYLERVQEHHKHNKKSIGAVR